MKREDYLNQLKAQLDGWNAELDHMEAKARIAKADTRIEYEKQMADLRERRDEAKKKIDEIAASSEGAWEELKAGADDIWERFKQSLSRAKTQFG